MYVPDVRVTLTALPGDAKRCEVNMQVDLRKGLGPNIFGYGAVAGGGGTAGAVIGGVIGAKALALAGAALLGPVLGGALLLGGGVLAAAGPVYRWELRKTTEELDTALAAVDTSIRAIDIFGEVPPIPPTRRSGGDDSTLLLMG